MPSSGDSIATCAAISHHSAELSETLVTIHVQPANSLDARAMARIHAAGFAHPWDESAIRLMMDKPTSLALAAFLRSNEAIGFIMCRVMADEAEILSIATAPELRRNGVGAKLLVSAMEMARLKGARAMFLEVAGGNRAALALYDKLGFSETGRREGYYSQGRKRPEDAVLMRRELTG